MVVFDRIGYATASRLAATIGMVSALAGVAVAQEVPAGMTRVSPGKATRVFVMAAFDDQCRSIAPPAIAVVKAPAKGSVTLREGQATTVQSSLSGKCTGARVIGTGIYYNARADGAGEDTFAIEARLATGELAQRSFQMFISE